MQPRRQAHNLGFPSEIYWSRGREWVQPSKLDEQQHVKWEFNNQKIYEGFHPASTTASGHEFPMSFCQPIVAIQDKKNPRTCFFELQVISVDRRLMKDPESTIIKPWLCKRQKTQFVVAKDHAVRVEGSSFGLLLTETWQCAGPEACDQRFAMDCAAMDDLPKMVISPRPWQPIAAHSSP